VLFLISSSILVHFMNKLLLISYCLDVLHYVCKTNSGLLACPSVSLFHSNIRMILHFNKMFIFQPQDSSVLRSHSSPELKFEQPVLAATSPLVTDDSAELQPGPESQKPVPIMRSVSVSGTDIEKKHPLSDDKQSPLCGVEIRTTSSFETAHSKREQRPRSGILSSVSEESDLATSSNRHAGKCIETLSIFFLR